MKKVKIFKDGRDSYERYYKYADERVNEFLEENKGKIEFVDVKCAVDSDSHCSILLTYNTLDDTLDDNNDKDDYPLLNFDYPLIHDESKEILKNYIRYCCGQFMIFGRTCSPDNWNDRFYGLKKGTTYYLFKKDFEEYLKCNDYDLTVVIGTLCNLGILTPTYKNGVVERYYKKVSIMNKKMWCYVVDVPEDEE